MTVSVMRIGKMRMAMDQGRVSMPMTVPCAYGHRWLVAVIMVRVMGMVMTVSQCFVNMFMGVALVDVQPKTHCH